MPCVRDIGLWDERLQRAYVDLGVFDLGDQNLDLLTARDQEMAEKLDAERFAAEEAERTAEVAEAVEEGARTEWGAGLVLPSTRLRGAEVGYLRRPLTGSMQCAEDDIISSSTNPRSCSSVTSAPGRASGQGRVANMK